ncbi:MAG: 6-bladed beta-propeller [Tannerellaceae bacterium]|nr:6-bladed beta-propeller [Tannerellaceae bacterium]
MTKRFASYKLFDKTGNFLCHLSKRGPGPGEHLSAIYDSYIDETNNLAYLLSWQSRQILVYDLQGNLHPSRWPMGFRMAGRAPLRLGGGVWGRSRLVSRPTGLVR